MQQRPKRTASGNAALVAIILLAGIVLAIANVVVLLGTVPRATASIDASSLVELYRLCPPCMIYFIAAPLVIVILLAIVVGRRTAETLRAGAEVPPPQVTAPAPPSPAPALRLLALLQQEGRLLDFLAEDIDDYSDGQVGAAVRSIHAGCRKALQERIELQRILPDDDGSEVVIDADFDRAAVRLTGNVTGAPPFRGTLQHGGWRATRVALPESPASVDASIVAPAEVEIP